MSLTRFLKPGKIGQVAVERATAGAGYGVPPGEYVRLRIDGATMMANTPCEYETSWEAVNEAHGHVLIGGLGLGAVLHCILDRPEVLSVTVVEKSPDVIKLVGSQFRSPKLDIVKADILEWQPPEGRLWNVIFFDIWPTPHPKNVRDIARLHQQFSSRLDRSDPEAWCDSWQADFLRDMVDSAIAEGRARGKVFDLASLKAAAARRWESYERERAKARQVASETQKRRDSQCNILGLKR